MREAGLTLRLAPKRGHRSPEELDDLLGRAAAAIVSTDPFDAWVLSRHPTLAVIARVGVGLDSIDMPVASELGIAVTSTRGANEATVADHTVALMLAVLRRIAEHDRNIRNGLWPRTGQHTPAQLTGLTVGLIGYGAIGQRVAARLHGFDVEVLVHDPALGPESRPALEIASACDVVSLHCPLDASTRGMIDAEFLGHMRPSAILVNTARGEVVDEPALIRALREGCIAGAGLDVFETEPPVGSPLLEMSNVVLSPHVGGVSASSIREMTMRCARSVVQVLNGEEPEGLVNPVPDVLQRHGWKTAHAR